MSNLKILAGDTAIYGFGSVVKKIVGIFLLPFYTRALSPAEYGILDSLGTFSYFVAIILGLGITGATGRYFFIAKNDNEKGSVLYTSVIMRVVSTLFPILIMLFFADNISVLLFKTDEYAWVVVLTLLLVPVQSISQLQEVLFRYYRKPWKYLLVSSLRSIINPTLGILFVVILQWGVFGANLASLISAIIIMMVAYFYYTRKKYMRNFSFVWARKMLKFGFPLIFTGMLIWVNNVSDRFFLLHFTSLKEIGFYSVANIFSQPILIINMAIGMSSSVLIMSLYSDEKSSEKPNTKKFLIDILYIYLSISIVIAIFISIFSYEIVYYLTTPDYISAIVAIPFLLFAIILDQIFQITASGMTLKEKSKPYVWISLIAASTNIGLNFYFIPKYGFLGASITTVLSNIAFFITGYLWSQKYFRINWRIHKPAILFVLAFGISAFFPFAQLKFNISISIWYKVAVFLSSLALPFIFGFATIEMLRNMALMIRTKFVR